MCKLQSARIQRPDDSQWLPDNYVLCVLSSDLRFEPIRDPCVAQALNTLRQGTIQDDVEGKFVVISWQNLRLPFTCIPKLPGLLKERTFSPGFPTSSGGG